MKNIEKSELELYPSPLKVEPLKMKNKTLDFIT